MSNSIQKRAFYIGKELALIALIFSAVYLISKPINSWLGQKALDNTGLNYLSYEQAMNLSAETGKPVMLEFSALWCGNCRRLDAQVLSNATVREKIQTDYLFARLDWDSDANQKIYDLYSIRGFPVIVIVDTKTNSVTQLPTTFSAEQFLQFI